MRLENAPSLLTVEQMQLLHCVEVTPLNLALVELQAGDCRYPYGDTDFTFCGLPALAGAPYCVPHYHLCRQVPR